MVCLTKRIKCFMERQKKLSNPFSTGNGGAHFEAHVQASFVMLMLTGGYAPCLPEWPIVEIKLQGKVDGYSTDDLIVFVEDPRTKERRKLLGQVKHSININQSDKVFYEVLLAAWKDFTTEDVFTKGKDAIALLTGPLTRNDLKNVQFLLNQAKTTKSASEFYRNIETSNFSPSKSQEKLAVFKTLLTQANDGKDITDENIYRFLTHYYLLNYDLGVENSAYLSLLISRISQFLPERPRSVWARVVELVQTMNQAAGTITLDKIPIDLLDEFKIKSITIPRKFEFPKKPIEIDWKYSQYASFLALTTLIGSWNEKGTSETDIITRISRKNYDDWIQTARDILHLPNSQLSFSNGIWKITQRVELWKLVGNQILDQDLNIFEEISILILQEPNPAFQLSAEERYLADFNGKGMTYSNTIRNGITEGLAILGSNPEICDSCSQEKPEETCSSVIRKTLGDADWIQWGSVNNLLPNLAEASPSTFLDAVENALQKTPCPFDELFAQEGKGIFGENYLTGLFWALEGLAWDEQYLVRTCIILGEIAQHDPGGQWKNRPSNSLKAIFLPWFPQTLANFHKRKAAVATLFEEYPEIAWNLIIALLPQQYQVASRTYKPKWRLIVQDEPKEVTPQEYWEQILYYSNLAMDKAGTNANRLSVLIDHLDNLAEPALVQLIDTLNSQKINNFSKDDQLLLWKHLTDYLQEQHRRSTEKPRLTQQQLQRITDTTQKFAPTDPIELYQPLFTEDDFDAYESDDDWEKQHELLENRREKAIHEIINRFGINGILEFANIAVSPWKVGYSTGRFNDKIFEENFLPQLLFSTNKKHIDLAEGFIKRRYQINGWKWCDDLDKAKWTLEQIGQFLTCLPFDPETWKRAEKWLGEKEIDYWARTKANAYQTDSDLSDAIEKLAYYGRPYTAIKCLYEIQNKKQPLNIDLCTRILLMGINSKEAISPLIYIPIVNLIKVLQAEPNINQDDLLQIEWAYFPLLNQSQKARPIFLERKLSSDPDFFCDVIRLIYRSKKEQKTSTETSQESQNLATKAWHLLQDWKVIPGTKEDNSFSIEFFNKWLQCVISSCEQSGHLGAALYHIGKVMFFAPKDPDGLWINRTVAAALNASGMNEIRDGFWAGVIQSRGFHWIDPSGEPEKLLAKEFRDKAEDIENAGYVRFSLLLIDIAQYFEHDAKRIIKEHNDELSE